MEVIRNHLFKFLPVVLAFSFCPSVSDADQSSLLCYIKKRVETKSRVCQNNVSPGYCCQEDQLFIQNVSVHLNPWCKSIEKCAAVCCGTKIISRTLNDTDRTVIESVFKTSGCFKETDDVLSKLPYNTGLEAVVITYTCQNSESKVSIGVIVPIVAVIAVIAVVTTVFVVVLMGRRRRTALRDTYPTTREDNHLSIKHIHNDVLSYQTPPTVTNRNDIPSYSVVDKIHVNCEHAQTESDHYTRIYNTINLQQLPVIKNPIYGYGPDRTDSNDSSYYDHVGEWAHPQVSESDYYAHIGCPNVGPGGGAADCDMYSHTSGTGTQDDNGTRNQFVKNELIR